MRNLKKILLTSALPFLLCSSYIKASDSKEAQNKIILAKEKMNRKKEAKNVLESIENSSFSETKYEINYSVTFPLEDTDSEASNIALCSDIDNAVSYNIKYIKDANLMFIDSLENNDGSTKENKYYGFPYINDDGDVDVNYSFDGSTVSLGSLPGGPTTGGGIDIGGIKPQTPKVYDLMSIGVKIATLNEAKLAAIGSETPVDLLTDGPTRYMLFLAKMNMIESNYKNNAAQKQPNGLITDQPTNKEYEKWKFGLKYEDGSSQFISTNGTLASNGCGCIALYNMLYESGADPYLPALIALIQYMNADLVIGAFGVNPLDDTTKNTLSTGLNLFFNSVVMPLMQASVPILAKLIHDDYLSKNPVWRVTELLLPGTGEIAEATIATALETIILAITTLELFAELYLQSLSSFTDIVKIYSKGDYTAVSCTSYKTFISNMSKYSQGIITFWNDDDISYGAHTVYVRRTAYMSLTAYNFDEDYPKKTITTSVGQFTTDSLYIFGYVWKKS